MSLLTTLVKGRPDGIRSKLRSFLGAGAPADAPPPAPAARASEPAEKALGLRMEAPKDVTPPDGYEVVLHRDALPDGQVIEVIIGGTAICVARVGDRHYAISNTCAHAGGPLGEGQLDRTVVTCPYHGWQYDVTDGRCLTNPSVSVKSYDVKVVGDAVCVQM